MVGFELLHMCVVLSFASHSFFLTYGDCVCVWPELQQEIEVAIICRYCVVVPSWCNTFSRGLSLPVDGIEVLKFHILQVICIGLVSGYSVH